MGGFTLVELVVTLVLIGILSISAVARLPDRASLDEQRLAWELRERLGAAQQSALANGSAATALTLTREAGGFRIAASRGATSLLDRLIDTPAVTVTVSAGAASGPVTTASPLTLTFGALGDVTGVSLGAATGSAANGVALTVSGTGSASLCVFPTGFTDARPCG